MGLFLTQQNKLFFTSKLVCAAFFVPQGLLICLRMKKKKIKNLDPGIISSTCHLAAVSQKNSNLRLSFETHLYWRSELF